MVNKETVQVDVKLFLAEVLGDELYENPDGNLSVKTENQDYILTDDDFNILMSNENLAKKLENATDIHDGIMIGLDIGFRMGMIQMLNRIYKAKSMADLTDISKIE